LAITYQSRVNWKSERDILRCNANFHKRPRYDSLIFSAEDDQSALGPCPLELQSAPKRALQRISILIPKS
ncbi:hypothetical protein R3P38DRAFT_2584461, partial [Favolaschia claudopus]